MRHLPQSSPRARRPPVRPHLLQRVRTPRASRRLRLPGGTLPARRDDDGARVDARALGARPRLATTWQCRAIPTLGGDDGANQVWEDGAPASVVAEGARGHAGEVRPACGWSIERARATTPRVRAEVEHEPRQGAPAV